MRLLLDTHVFLWYITADPRLTVRVRDMVTSADNEVFLSVASIWEATIKHALGRLPLPEPPATYLPSPRHAHSITSLPIDEDVFPHLEALPAHHHDTFDRILSAQSLQHGLTLVTVDRTLFSYDVPLLSAKEADA